MPSTDSLTIRQVEALEAIAHSLHKIEDDHALMAKALQVYLHMESSR